MRLVANLLENDPINLIVCRSGGAFDASRSICRDREIAMMLFESPERDILAAEAIDPAAAITRLLDHVTGCSISMIPQGARRRRVDRTNA